MNQINTDIHNNNDVVVDWDREAMSRFWEPNRQLLRAIRRYQVLATKNSIKSRLQQKLVVLQHRFWSAVTGADIPLNASIGGGLLIPHPNGIVIHPSAHIGANCLIFQQVTLGTTHKSDIPPHVGNHVDIGAGAKILGNISIGNNVKIGANAVITKSVPDNTIVIRTI